MGIICLLEGLIFSILIGLCYFPVIHACLHLNFLQKSAKFITLNLCIFPCSMTRNHQISIGYRADIKVRAFICFADSASLMPAERQTAGYIEPAEPISRIFSEHSGFPISQIRSTRQAPSTIVTEQYLQARAASGPNLYPECERNTHGTDLKFICGCAAFQKPNRYSGLTVKRPFQPCSSLCASDCAFKINRKYICFSNNAHN